MKRSKKKETSPLVTRQKARNDLQRESILEVAARLFIEKGYGGTNINDIADALGCTRTAVYYYFDNKEEILEGLTEEITEKAGALSKATSRRSGLSPEEVLRELVLQHATLILTNPVQFRVVERNEMSLPEPRRSAARAARRNVLDNFVRVIQEGMTAGAFEAPDARVTAFAILGMCNWGAWWFEGSDMPVATAANALAELALRSVARSGRRAHRPASIAECIRRLKENLSALEELQRSTGSPVD